MSHVLSRIGVASYLCLFAACGPPPSTGAPADLAMARPPVADLASDLSVVAPAPDLVVVATPDLTAPPVVDLATPPGNGTLAATIVVTASTNTPEIDCAVYTDGSADRTIKARAGQPGMPKRYPPHSPQVVTFLRDLAVIGDVSMIPTGACLKSASFGTYTRVNAGGHTSGDLQCLQNPTPIQTAFAADCVTLTMN